MTMMRLVGGERREKGIVTVLYGYNHTGSSYSAAQYSVRSTYLRVNTQSPSKRPCYSRTLVSRSYRMGYP